MAKPELTEKASRLPRQTGVYLFKDARDRVLYVGKAKDLRARVRQYLAGTDERFMVRFLVASTYDIEVVRTQSEKEALILENTLIKKYRPRYNTKLIDDANFLHLRIDPAALWPDFHLVRSIKNKKHRHFGPFASASRARATLEFVSRNFPLRTCSDSELRSRKRPCLLHQMNRCLAPCVGLCTKEEYDQTVEDAVLFLQGRNTDLVKDLKQRMVDAADALAFERAARYRDLIKAIEATIQKQHVVDKRLGDRDVWALHREGDGGMMAQIPVRQGMMHEANTMALRDASGADDDIMSSILNTWYQEGTAIPPEIVVSHLPPDHGALAQVLTERRGGTVRIHQPQRGGKLRIITLAMANARSAFEVRVAQTDRAVRALNELKAVCRLPRLPHRIECFDNSNIQGTDPVAAMVVFTDGRPDRAAYRRYRIKTVVGSDDYATMREVLARRFRRALESGEFPDLLVIDGGKGQVNAVCAVLEELGVPEQPVIGLAKPKTERARGDDEALDKIVIPGQKNLIRLGAHSPGLQLLQSIRDESHRAAVGYHRKVRRKRTLRSSLDDVPGLGPSRRRTLLAHFGSIKAVQNASMEELESVPGIGPELAGRILSSLATQAFS